MDAQQYVSLFDQVERQTAEAASLDATIAAAQPGLDALQAAVDGSSDADKPAALAVLEGPKSAQDARIKHASDLRDAIAQCQAQMATSGLTVDVPAVRLAGVKTAALARIDAEVDAIYAAVTGNRTSEYAVAEEEANAFKAASYSGAVPGSVEAWATPKGWTAQQACDDIFGTAQAWRAAQMAIRAARLARKEQARVAADAAGVATALAAWAAFNGAIRAQLGL